MDVFLYVVMFAIGTLMGSFCTLAVYRIPLKKDITHEHSFCPNCNHKLGFLDLIPLLSYICLKGKCRYCKQKIRIRYFIIELLAGIASTVYALSFNFSFTYIEVDKLICLSLGILYIVGLVIISGIDKERKQIQKGVLIYNFVVSLAYIIYLFTVGCSNINRYAIYLFFMFALFLIYLIDIKKKEKRKISIGLYICIINVIANILQNIFMYYLI